VTITFAEVTSPGETTLTLSGDPPHGPPVGFRLHDMYYEITTTAGYVGPITICISYDPDYIPGNREEHLKLFHAGGTGWDDATVSVDTTNHVICGEISSLSWFAIGWPTYDWLGFLPPLESRQKPFKRGSTIPIKFRIGENGQPLPDATGTLTVYYLADGAPQGEPEVVSTAAGDWGDQFRYSLDEDLYIFNLSTKDPSYLDYYTYLAEVALDDGTTHSIEFSLK
jgi:hypothetical protein